MSKNVFVAVLMAVVLAFGIIMPPVQNDTPKGTWVLLLFFGYPVPIVVKGYATEPTCSEAGKFWITLHGEQGRFKPFFYCVPGPEYPID